MRNLDVLAPHEHHVPNIEQVDPVHSGRAQVLLGVLGDIFGYTESVSLSRFVHVRVLLEPFYLFNADKAHFKLPDDFNWNLAIMSCWMTAVGLVA